MIWTRIYRTPTDTLLAATDEELLGKTLSEGKFRLEVSETFYKEVLIEEDGLRDLMYMCSVANLVGNRCVSIAIELGFISKENVIYIQGVPHAQFTTMD